MSILTYIEVFVTVVEEGSFAAAADSLGISRPVVSKQVSQLEQQLGVQLLHRTTRRLRLTEAGQVFFRYAQSILANAKEAEQVVLPLQSEPKGKLKISAPESLAISLLGEALREFQQRFPQIVLEVVITGQYIDLIENGIDIALRMGDLDDSTLMARKLMPSTIHVCASPEFWKIHGKPAHPSELKDYNCLIYSQSPKSAVWHFHGEQGEGLYVRVNGNLKSDSGKLIVDAGINGQGVFIAPSYMVTDLIKSGQLETVLEAYMPTSTALYALYPYSKMVSHKVRAFIGFLSDKWQS